MFLVTAALFCTFRAHFDTLNLHGWRRIGKIWGVELQQCPSGGSEVASVSGRLHLCVVAVLEDINEIVVTSGVIRRVAALPMLLQESAKKPDRDFTDKSAL